MNAQTELRFADAMHQTFVREGMRVVRLTAKERGAVGGAEAASRMPPWLVQQAEQAIERFRGQGPFSSDSVRACLTPAAEAWLQVTMRANVWPGWWRGAARRFHLRRTGMSVESQRDGSRGRRVATWILPADGKVSPFSVQRAPQ